MDLRELQCRMQAAILSGDVSHIDQYVTGSPDVYIDAYRIRRLRVLQLRYFSVRELMGSAAFDLLALNYVMTAQPVGFSAYLLNMCPDSIPSAFSVIV